MEDLDDAMQGPGMDVMHGNNMPADAESEEEEEAYMDTRGGAGLAAAMGSAAKSAEAELDDSVAQIEARVDPAEWKLELERVGPKLKITLAADTKDWRSHLEQAHSHKKEIEQLLPESKVHLDKVNAEVSSELEKVATRERFLNSQFDALIMEYRLVRERLGEVQVRRLPGPRQAPALPCNHAVVRAVSHGQQLQCWDALARSHSCFGLFFHVLFHCFFWLALAFIIIFTGQER